VPNLNQSFKSISRAGSVVARFEVESIDKGLQRIQNTLKSIQTDKSYVKAGLLAGKAGKTRPAKLRIEDERHAEFAKAQAAVNPILLALFAHHARKAAAAPLTSVQVGIFNEFGTSTQPARPFIRPAFEQNRAAYMEILRRLVQQSVYQGKMPFTRALGIIGSKMAADMKKYVTAGSPIPPPNAPKYFQEKVERGYHKLNKRRSNAKQPISEGPIPPPRTLVDTGRMVGSITYAVIAKSTGDVKRGEDYGK
jgi:HK97 gp10 family phage protein